MTKTTQIDNIYVGVDVSKQKLDITISPSNKHFLVTNDDAGYKELVKKLPKNVNNVVFEATGGYEQNAAIYLQAKGIPISVVNPRQMRDFAKALGKLAKTDKIDSRVIALFAERIQPMQTTLPTKKQQELSSLRKRRQQLVEMIKMERNRLELCDKIIVKSIKKSIKNLDNELLDINKKIEKHINEDEDLSKKKK